MTTSQNAHSGGSAATNFGIVAWVAYGIASAFNHWELAALLALIVAGGIVVHEYRCDAVKLMSCTTAVFFAFALVTTAAAGPALFKNFNIFMTWGVFAAVTWVALAMGFPFTIQYAREQAPPEIWDHPLFLRLNVILTVAFGLMFTVNVGLGIGALRTGRLLSLGLILPISLLIAAMVFAAQYPKYYARKFAPAPVPADSGTALHPAE